MMSRDFADILRRLMDNRGLTPTIVSRASARAESTIRQLLDGRVSPKPEILRDIAPVLEMSLADLHAIAGVEDEPASKRPAPYRAAKEIGQLVAAASGLAPDQVRQLIDLARILAVQNRDVDH